MFAIYIGEKPKTADKAGNADAKYGKYFSAIKNRMIGARPDFAVSCSGATIYVSPFSKMMSLLFDFSLNFFK
ncbi:MAG: hypothetical protein IMW92_12435 [Bacillales bacterium]|nr:hypothetical protein [Bacillales bacterium]